LRRRRTQQPGDAPTPPLTWTLELRLVPVVDGEIGPVRSLAISVRGFSAGGVTVVIAPELPCVAPTAAGLQGRPFGPSRLAVEPSAFRVPDTPGPVGVAGAADGLPGVVGGLSVLLAPPVAPTAGARPFGIVVLAPLVPPLFDCAHANPALPASSSAARVTKCRVRVGFLGIAGSSDFAVPRPTLGFRRVFPPAGCIGPLGKLFTYLKFAESSLACCCLQPNRKEVIQCLIVYRRGRRHP
jgi:hypothetical protein